MFNLGDLITKGINAFFSNFFNDFISYFAQELANVMSTSQDTLNLPIVQNGIHYAQVLALTLLVLKSMNEAFQTYILHQNGDPEADPFGLLIRTAQAVAVISTLPWIVMQIFTLGTKIALDVSGLGTGQTGIADWSIITAGIIATGGTILIIFCIILAACLIVIGIQAAIRGAELALMSVIGPIMALNLTANNRSVWSAWFKQVVIICTTQALQILLMQATISSFTSQLTTSGGLLTTFGWLWVSIKSPKYVQQIAHSTGFSGAVGGTAKQTGSMYLMRRMIGR